MSAITELHPELALIELHITNLTGHKLSVMFRKTTLCLQVKEYLQCVYGCPPNQMRLTSSGKELDNAKSLYHYFDKATDANVYLIYALRGD